MARSGFLDENRSRAFPFREGTVPSSLPNDAVVDAGFTIGPGVAFETDVHKIWLASVARSGADLTFTFVSDAPRLIGWPLVFTRTLTDPRFAVEHTENNPLDSQSSGVCDAPLWYGYLVTGDLGPLGEVLADGDTWEASPGDALLEPSLVDASALGVSGVSLANADRTEAITDPSCDPLVPSAYDPGIVRVWERCLIGPVVFKGGYNFRVSEDVASNALVFQPVVGEGSGEPCGEVPTYPAEGSDGDDLSGSLRCDEVLRSIQGQGGPSFAIVARRGVAVFPDPDNHRIIVDVDFSGLSFCPATDSQSASDSVPA